MSALNRLPQAVYQTPLLKRLYHLSKPILDVHLFYLVREGLSDDDGFDIKPRLEVYDVVFLKPPDMKVIAASPEVPETEDALLKRLSEGCLCIGIKHHDEIAAYMWCNLRECSSQLIKFKLKPHEAYLMDARTLSSYKGKNLAPYLRIELYRYLRKMGRTNFISFTFYLNTPAHRFKEKLKAKPQKLFLWFRLFMRYQRAVLLKEFET